MLINTILEGFWFGLSKSGIDSKHWEIQFSFASQHSELIKIVYNLVDLRIAGCLVYFFSLYYSMFQSNKEAYRWKWKAIKGIAKSWKVFWRSAYMLIRNVKSFKRALLSTFKLISSKAIHFFCVSLQHACFERNTMHTEKPINENESNERHMPFRHH